MTARLAAAALAALAAGSLSAQTADGWDVTRPRGQTRTIDFTTTEGTWMSVDLSPDGRWIVFDLLGHVYRVPAAGGEAEALTQSSGIAVNFHPRYSPDGAAIAFISDRAGQRNLWLMDADGGSPRPVFLDPDSRAVEPAWMPDGRSILVTRQMKTPSGFYRTNDEIWRFPRDGGAGQLVVRLEGGGGGAAPARAGVWTGQDRVQWASATPDGRYVYFHSSVFSGADRQLKRIELATGAIDDVTQSGARFLACCGRPAYPPRLGEVAPEVSPDGRWLAFARKIPGARTSVGDIPYVGRTTLWLRDLATGQERMVMDPISNDAMDQHPAWEHRVLPGYSWARDGRSIVLSQGGRIRRLWIESGRVETVPFRALVHREISGVARSRVRLDDSAFTAASIRWASTSPDGRWLAFEAVGRIWRKALPNGKPEPLAALPGAGRQLMPAWSPDGRWIAFVTWSDSAGGAVWRAPAGRGAAARLSGTGTPHLHPWWSADGGAVFANRWDPALAYSPYARGWQIVRLTARDSAAEVVRRAGPLVRGPGAWVYRVRGSRLTAVRPDAGDPWTHPALGGASAHVVPSPDGRRLAFVHHHEVYAASLPAAVAPGDSVSVAIDGLTRLSTEGGRDPHWAGATVVGFTSADRYVRHDLATGRADTVSIGLRVPRDAPRGRIALAGARIIAEDPDRRAEPGGRSPAPRFREIPRGTVIVEGSRIRCVGSCDTTGVDRVLDLTGKTIIPGLVDVHAHHLVEDGVGPIPERRHSSARYLAWGVTTVHDPSADLDQSFAIGELIEAGALVGPRTFSTGVALTCSDFDDLAEIEHRRDAREQVRRAMRLGAVSIKDYKQCTRVQRQWMQDVGRELGVTVTSEGADPIYFLELIMDGAAGWEHPIQTHPVYSDYTRFMGLAGAHYSAQLILSDYPHGDALEYWMGREDLWRDRKVLSWTPWQEVATRRTLVAKPPEEYIFPILSRDAAAIKRAGGYLPVGAHGELDGPGTHWEMWAYGLGLTPLEALEAGSYDGAHFLGLEDEIGSIAEGKLADLLVLDANPLERIEHSAAIRFVMKAGRLYDGESLDEIWPRQRRYGTRPWNPPEMLRTDVRTDGYWDRPDR